MADYQYITQNGVIVPDTADLQAEVVAEWQEAFGADLVTTAETPQGVMITGEVLARDAAVRNNADVANQINPNIAGGVFLDAIWSLTGGARAPASYSQILGVILGGVAGTLIPEGSQAQSDDGDVFALQAAVVLGPLGTADGSFIALEPGPIGVAPNTLSTIATGVLGWESVTNPNAAVPGSLVQSDASARLERKQTLALQGQSTPEAIMSGVRALPGVRSLAFRENITGAAQVIDGVSLVEHSIWVCVDGGAQQDIAETILEKKSAGADMNGTTTVAVVEPSSGQSYNVKFQRPTDVSILVRATVRAGSGISDPINTTRDAILAYANGEIDGEVGFAVGEDVSPFELAGAVSIISPGIYVTKMEVAYNVGSPTYQTTTLPIALTEVARLIASGVTVILS